VSTRSLIAAAALTALLAGGYFYRQATRRAPPELGVPVYPGARFQDQVTLGSTRTVVLETADAPERVIAFYKTAVADRTRVLERDIGGAPGAVLELRDGRLRRIVTISVDADTRRTLIAVATR
jgi:hypothetical protein